MIFISSHHHRRGSTCPRTNAQHGPAGTIEQSTWVMLLDCEQLADVSAAEDPEMYTLLQELRAAIPVAPLGVAVCRREDFPTPAGVCNYHPTNPLKNCAEYPAHRPMEISVVPGRDCQRPRAKCPRCIERDYPAISAVLHARFGTAPPAPIQPPAPRELTPAEIIALNRARAIAGIECAVNAIGSRSKQYTPRQVAEMIAESIQTLITLAKEKQ